MGYLDMPEKELVRRAVAGDQMAYRAIYQLHEKAIRGRVSGYFKWKADVDDVVSESFQKAFVNLPNFDTERELRPWLSTIATRTALDHLASIKREDQKKEGIKFTASGENAEGQGPITDVDPEEVPALKTIVVDVMENVLKLSVPLTVECSDGKNWLEAH